MANVNLILRQDVDKLGKAGEMVRVKPGYARNYLLPRALAVKATGANVNQIEHERQAALAQAAKARSVFEAVAAQVEGLVVEIPMQVGEGDRLYGSVTTRDVADAIHRHGIDIDRRKLQLPEALKTLGEHEVILKLGSDVSASLKVRITRTD